MRLTPEQNATIKEAVKATAGPQARIRLFGSRLDDHRKGGDVDLLVTLNEPVENVALIASRIEARLERVLGGRKVDVIPAAPNIRRQPIHEVAEREGVPL